ncbi:MAG: MFS transporter [Granulosicoccus sp.]
MTGNSNKLVILTLWLAGLLAGGQFAKVSVILPEFQVIYPQQADQIAWLLTLVSVVGALLGGAAASLANRFSLQPVLIASLVSAAGLSLWQATYPSYALMALSRIVEGATHLGIVVTAPALMAEMSSDRWRGATMALWGSFFGVSFAIFGWFGIPFVDAFGVSSLLQLHGVCLFIVAVLVGFMLREHRAADVRSSASSLRGKSPLSAFRDARVVWSGISWFFYTLTFLALLTILPAQFSEQQRPQITTAMSLVAIATGLLILPVALLYLKATTTVLVGFLVACLVAAVGVWSNPLILAISLFAILGIIQSGTFAAVAELNNSTDARTLGYGAMAQTGNVGNLVGTPFLLVVLEAFDLGSLLITTAAIYAVGFFTLLYSASRIRGTEKIS